MITKGYKKGDYCAVCDRCYEKMYGSMLRPDGMYPSMLVCKKCYWRRHPAEDRPIVPVEIPVRNARPFVEGTEDAPTLTRENLED